MELFVEGRIDEFREGFRKGRAKTDLVFNSNKNICDFQQKFYKNNEKIRYLGTITT